MTFKEHYVTEGLKDKIRGAFLASLLSISTAFGSINPMALYQQISKHEGVRNQVYKDTQNHLTIGIGFNTTTTFAGQVGSFLYSAASGTTTNFSFSTTGNYPALPSLGINNVNALELGAAPNGATMLGTTASMLLQAQWRG